MEEGFDGVRLHLGCGKKKWDGFINVDLFGAYDVQADLKSLPFPDNYADEIVSIHVFEHFYRWEAQGVLDEWERVLKPGGRVVLELPCMNKVMHYISQCLQSKEPFLVRKSWFALWGDPNYRSVEMTHKWGYTKEELTELLQDAGFRDIQSTEPRYHMKSRDMRMEAYK